MSQPNASEPEAGRPHSWIIKTENPHPYWEERHCPTCLLHDMRVRDRSTDGPRRDWGVVVPCIEPVPDQVSYGDLVRDIREHGVKERPLAYGVPGDWTVGFSLGGRGRVYPSFHATAPRTLEYAFADLTRWIRVRRYDTYLHSDLSYQRSLAQSDGNVIDED